VGRKRVDRGEGWLKKEESGVKWGIEQESTLTEVTTFNLGEGDTRCFLAPTNPVLMKKVA
jgi:hypothetical protein